MSRSAPTTDAVDKMRAQSQPDHRTIQDSIASTVLEAEYANIKEELDKEAARAKEESVTVAAHIDKERAPSLARASERDTAVGMVREVASYAPEATQHVE
ncbi:MAG: hypothetical protein ACKPKO_31890 [Candidatus Fonsibacter sp.]